MLERFVQFRGLKSPLSSGTNSKKLNALCRDYAGTPYRDFDAFLAHRPLEMVAIGLHATQGIATAERGLVRSFE
jgi:hypothetical protein